MGLFDGRSNSTSYVEVRHRPKSHSISGSTRGISPDSTTSKNRGYFIRPAASSRSSSSFFNFGFGGNSRSSGERSRGFFSSSSSSYRRSPRAGYIAYLWQRLQRMLRELWAYARRHPMKAFFAVVVPLLSAGGAIHGLMKQFGVRAPGLEGLMGGSSRTVRGGYYGSSGYGGGLGGMGGGAGGGWMNNAGSLMQIAKAFM